jgi:hypothetical protein
MSKYPRFGQTYRVKPRGLCTICGGNKSDARVDVEVNQFRGDDVVYKVHQRCINGKNNRELLKLLGVENERETD